MIASGYTGSKIPRVKQLSSTMTLADGLENRKDNFLLLRFIAASMVIYGHGGAIANTKGASPDLFLRLGWGIYSGTLAVCIFFVVSGFMIAGSYLRRQHLADFLWARLLRIYPAYFCCLVICAVVLGAVYTALPLNQYFENTGVLHYVTQNVKLQTTMVWTLPEVFDGNPHDSVINGAIWTLPAEFRMYLWVAIVGALGILSRRWLCALIIAVLFGLGILRPDADIFMIPSIYLHLAAMFGIGTLCYLFRDHVPVGWPYVAAAVILAYLLRNTVFYQFALGLAIAQFSFAFAYCLPWYGFNRFGDYSYGIYLWGYPMQQALAHHFPLMGPKHNACFAFMLALAMALLSWHFIEKPSLMLKSLPGKLFRYFKSVSGWSDSEKSSRVVSKLGPN
ncbi:acyltransferase [Dyella jejuensis]|uniref:Acyltransferase n=1 Tax=Dyella jejuensis TaxID=1432009 RepID=A0ABW8JIJ3_9GAMM